MHVMVLDQVGLASIRPTQFKIRLTELQVRLHHFQTDPVLNQVSPVFHQVSQVLNQVNPVKSGHCTSNEATCHRHQTSLCDPMF